MIPSVFQSINLRSGTKFTPLTEHIFQPEEIIWLCEEIKKMHPFWSDQITSIHAISKRYKIESIGLRHWITMFDNKIVFSEMKCLRKSDVPIDRKGMNRIEKWKVSVNRDPEELRNIINEELDATVIRRNKRIIGK